jgi:hypothetical protein
MGVCSLLMVPALMKQVESAVREALVQRRKLVGLVDVELLDSDAAFGPVGEIVQGGLDGGVTDGADDVPAPVEEFGRHGLAEAA